MKKTPFFFFLLLLPHILLPQCAMCRAVIETQEENTIAEGINNGILYLMAIPYLLVFIIGYVVYKKIKH